MDKKQTSSTGAEYKIACPSCGVRLTAKPKLAGRQLACPKCKAEFVVPGPPDTSPLQPPETEPEPPKRIPPTEKQKAFATELGVKFLDDIDRRELSKLIDAAIIKRDDERYQRLDEIQEKENRIREELREEIMAECDEVDPRLSVATPEQIINALDFRMMGSILVTFEYSAFGGIEELEEFMGKTANVKFTDDVDAEDVYKILTWVTAMLKYRNDQGSV